MHILGTSSRPDLPLAVVVGAGALGMAVARRLALSYRVLLADIDGARAEANAEAMRSEGCDASALACDVTSHEQVAALAGSVRERGGMGAWVQVAGLSPSLGDYRTIMRVNLMGAALVAAALLPEVRPGAAGVLIASLAAHSYTPSPEARAILAEPARDDLAERLAEVIGDLATPAMAYTHSKFGLLMMARRLAPAWGARDARIVSLSPGLIATPQGALEFEKSPGKRAMFDASPLRRECTMLEIADVAEFLVSPRASFISGTDLLVDGGLAAALGAI
ncbi:MAG: SDR family oxidoreductase [Novosphingobium sp.]